MYLAQEQSYLPQTTNTSTFLVATTIRKRVSRVPTAVADKFCQVLLGPFRHDQAPAALTAKGTVLEQLQW